MKQAKLAMVGAALVGSVLFTQSAFAKEDRDTVSDNYVGVTNQVVVQTSAQPKAEPTEQAKNKQAPSTSSYDSNVSVYGIGNDREK
ncbi:hypothetical protein ACQCN2_20765 [Brevibacillus ginsengisoli]|uniref:hypothetical protein n=1 Tax=Brevibacillus ginsengisoli TaxID=363854 RepID=UPI003CFB8ADE